MIGSLRGTLASKSSAEIILDVAGVGYRVITPLGVLSELPPVGKEAFLFIYTHVREDAITLYGFSSDGEKRVFTTLLGISGIGPKVALSIVSGIPYDEFLLAVETEDITRLTRIPGLGKKTAQRLVLELRGKLPREGVSAADTEFEDALSALVNLGYKKMDATGAIELARKDGHSDIEAVLREALKLLGKEQAG
jgi:Holliday junction DNA helicase RuvA